MYGCVYVCMCVCSFENSLHCHQSTELSPVRLHSLHFLLIFSHILLSCGASFAASLCLPLKVFLSFNSVTRILFFMFFSTRTVLNTHTWTLPTSKSTVRVCWQNIKSLRCSGDVQELCRVIFN